MNDRQARLLLLVEVCRLLVKVWYMSYICEAGCQSFTKQQTVYQSRGRLSSKGSVPTYILLKNQHKSFWCFTLVFQSFVFLTEVLLMHSGVVKLWCSSGNGAASCV